MLRASLEEDLGDPGDVTTIATVAARSPARAAVRAGERSIVAGLALFDPLAGAFRARGRPEEEATSLEMVGSVGDGSQVDAGGVVCTLAGTARALITVERTFLNFLGRLSGIATVTRAYVDAVRAVGSPARVLDTRKTTPGHRVLEKYAVACGGGTNHRIGLFDAVLIKDNHVVAAGGIGPAVGRALAKAPAGIKVEVECDSLDQVEQALAAGAKAVLLDNFTTADVATAVKTVAGRARVEVSGGITLETIGAYARSGADDISVGRLTHSAPSVDVSMEVELLR